MKTPINMCITVVVYKSLNIKNKLPDGSSKCSYLARTSFAFFGLTTPIGRDKSRNVAGSVRSSIWDW